MLQVIRSKRRFRYFFNYLQKQKSCWQNLLFWIDVEHFERQKYVIRHVFKKPDKDSNEFSVRNRMAIKDVFAVDRRRAAKDIFKTYISRTVDPKKQLKFPRAPREKKVFKMAQSTKDFGMSKRIKKNSEDKLHHIFTELKNIVWSDLNRHFLAFISEKWNPRFYHFESWCSSKNLNRSRKESILIFMEHREQPVLQVTDRYHATMGKKEANDNVEDAIKETKVNPPMLGISSLIMDMANIIATAASFAMVECLTTVSDEVNVDETVETRHNRNPLFLERAPPKLAVKLSVASIEVNLRTEMIMRMGSFFLLYEKKIQSVVERTSRNDVATSVIHQQREQKRAWRAFDESKVDVLLQKPSELVLDFRTGGLEIRLPVHQQRNNKTEILYAVIFKVGALSLTTTTSSGAKEVPGLLSKEKAKKAEFDMYDMKLPHIGVVVEHYGDADVDTKLNGNEGLRVHWTETFHARRGYQTKIVCLKDSRTP